MKPVWRRRLKAVRAVSLGLELGEYALRQALYGRVGRVAAPPLDARQAAWFRALDTHGIAIIPGYWDAAACAEARAAIDDFLARHPDRAWVDATGADHRVYGLDRVSPIVDRFHRDRAIFDVARAAWGRDIVSGFVSAGRLDGDVGNLGSGGQGWHRDGVTQQFKALLYLSDVDRDAGPFEVVTGTAGIRDRLRHILRSGAVARQTAWSDADVARIARTAPGSVVTACGPAGTLVLCHTYAIHRGRPAIAGSRYALTNYTFARRTLGPVVDYYRAMVPMADGRELTVASLLEHAFDGVE